MLGYVTEHLCLYLNGLTPIVSNCYIHVNMAKVGAVTVVLVTFNSPKKIYAEEQKKAEPYRDGALALIRQGGSSAQGMWGLQLSNMGWMTLWLSG